MLYPSMCQSDKERYKQLLSLIGSLSNMFSDSNIPYLYYRVAERIYCNSFKALDLSRGDVSVDAKYNNYGIGLKTFLIGNRKTFQKVAEFNADIGLYADLDLGDKIRKVSELRNARVNFTNNTHRINESLYHCVVRDVNKFFIYEAPMDLIDIGNIRNIKDRSGSITFEDGKNEYSFLKSKSTLTKRFVTDDFLDSFDIQIIEDPISRLLELVNDSRVNIQIDNILGTIYLPLYSVRSGIVENKSGLNQWNAGGRKRDMDEVYIPVPKKIHDLFINFFPDRDKEFDLCLPNSQKMKAKICQDNGKALMSNPNKDLGKWLLRDVLQLGEGTLVTSELLKIIGVDSVRIDKVIKGGAISYNINFAKSGSYEKFIGDYI